MVKLKPKNKSDRDITQISDYQSPRQHLLLFILASVLLHSLGLLIFGLYEQRQLVDQEKIDNKPIEFVVIPPEESQEKPPPETKQRAIENSVAEKTTEAKKTVVSEETPEPIAPRPTPPPPAQTAIPPKPTPSSTIENKTPVLSGTDKTPITTSKPKPAQKNNPVATRLPPEDKQPSESVPSQPNTTPQTGAAGLLGGDYQKTLANGGNDAFFSPEALAYKSVLNPAQLNALKDIDLSQYFAEIKRRVKSNWHPSYAVEEYTTFLTFEIQKNGQVTGLKVTKSSGSPQVDQESLAAVQNSAPFAPLPPEFPLAVLQVEFTFNIYIY